MKYVSLKFPDIIQLAKFRIDFGNDNFKTNAFNYTITGKMTDEQIVSACTKYFAILEILPGDKSDE